MATYDTLNTQQYEAVTHTEGALLIIAGAGSGKTRVLTHRTAWLIEEQGVNPYNIMAITFTNKAAAEMRERIDAMVGYGSESIWVTTFHSTCVRILRRFADHIGYENSFTIYDADDQKQVMKDVCRRLEIDTKIHKEKMFLNVISSAKDSLVDPTEFALGAAGDFAKQRQAQVYREYQATLKKNNAMDFDDLIMKTVELFRADSDVLDYYQERFKYIMVDEYQDTNTAQFELVRLLAGKYGNLCVVGDDDQSIYKFRGATIRNILNFEQYFPDARVIKLEQNYRSTQNILDAANSVIANNIGRKAKALWTDQSAGEKIHFKQFDTAYEEAEYVALDIEKQIHAGRDYSDFAVLYRTNAQSRMFEERFVAENIPYKLVGGVNFYARKEIKDLLAYLKTIDNARDDLAVKRIINIPKRGIGATSVSRIQMFADENEMSFFEAARRAADIGTLGRGAAAKVEPFVTYIRTMRSKAEFLGVEELLKNIIEDTGYVRELEAEDTPEADARIENIDELISKAASYEEHADEPSLSGFLEEVALVADIDEVVEGSAYVVLMTLHSAKGLEFPGVYLAGLEDGLFPSYMSITSDNAEEELEEERRLCYVGITRAMKRLTITSAKMRMVRGETRFSKVSRFVSEIPRELLSGTVATGKSIPQPEVSRRISPYAGSAKQILREKPVLRAEAKSFSTDATDGMSLGYKKGDRVRHMKFGEGIVTQIVAGGRDYEVTVDFDRAGTKKMFASFAKLKKV